MVKSKPSVFVVVVEYSECIGLFMVVTLLQLPLFYLKLNSFPFTQKEMFKYRQRKNAHVCLYLKKKVVRKCFLPEVLVEQGKQYYEFCPEFLLFPSF